MNLNPGKRFQNQNVNEIINRSENDMYLSEEGPNLFEALTIPKKDIKQAIKDLGENQWEKQFHGCDVIRNALRFHIEEISRTQQRSIIEHLHKLMSSPRSGVAKNAILTLTDCFVFIPDGQIQESEIAESYKLLIKKVGDTNQFLAEEARTALTTLSRNTMYFKTIKFLFPYYEERSANIRKQVSSCIETVLNDISSQNIWDWPQTHQKQLFKMLVFLLADSNQDVRINTRKSILTLEYGPNPLYDRNEVIKLIKANVSNNYDQQKLIEVLERGPEDDALTPLIQRSTGRRGTATSGKKSQYRSSVLTGSSPQRIDRSSIKQQNNDLINFQDQVSDNRSRI